MGRKNALVSNCKRGLTSREKDILLDQEGQEVKDMATVRYPIRYELRPTELAEGEQWIWLRLENVSEEPITDVTVKLISKDASRVRVKEPDNYIPSLPPAQEQEVGFKIASSASSAAYIAISAIRDGAPLRWESPYIPLTVGETVADIASLVAMGPRYPHVDEPVRLEVILRTFVRATDLRLAFWVDTPGGTFQRLGQIEVPAMEPGDECRYSVTFTPEETGGHTVYAYLQQDQKRIDRWMEHVYVT